MQRARYPGCSSGANFAETSAARDIPAGENARRRRAATRRVRFLHRTPPAAARAAYAPTHLCALPELSSRGLIPLWSESESAHLAQRSKVDRVSRARYSFSRQKRQIPPCAFPVPPVSPYGRTRRAENAAGEREREGGGGGREEKW